MTQFSWEYFGNFSTGVTRDCRLCVRHITAGSGLEVYMETFVQGYTLPSGAMQAYTLASGAITQELAIHT